MGVEIERLSQAEDFPLQEVLSHLHGLSQKEQWVMLRQGFERAADLVQRGELVAFHLVDDTVAGGAHLVRALYSPGEARALIEIPEESHKPGGRFPTVLHALEVIAAAVGLANQTDKSFNPNGDTIYPQPAIPYPDIEFVTALNGQAKDAHGVLIPLTVDPDKTNLVAIHPQARHINPEGLAIAYYQVIQGDTELTGDLMRHTMLVQARNRREKHDVGLSVVTKAEKPELRLNFPGRIARLGTGATGKVIVSRIAPDQV